MECAIEPRNVACRRGGGCWKGRTQYEQCRYARRCRPAGVEEHITCKRNASEPGRPHLARNRSAVPGHGRKTRRRSCRGRDEESDGCIVPKKRRTMISGQRQQRWRRERGRSKER